MSEIEVSREQGQAVELLLSTGLGIVRPVGDSAVAVITRLSPTEENPDYVGNVLRRTCAIGGEACKAVCELRENDLEAYLSNEQKRCADSNLAGSLRELGIETGDVLMVAVTGDEVGFGDKLPTYRQEDRLKTNPEGWSELPGFNAFFAREDEVPAIGSRLADCAHIEFEFLDQAGNTVIGFEHGTRPNMAGSNARKFIVDGQPVSYTEYVVATAIEHYGADPESFKIRLSSSIRAENFVKHFDSLEKLERHIPGWYDDGFVRNVTNPDWYPGDPVLIEDEWHADARGMILRDIHNAMQLAGIPAENFAYDNMLDPADANGEFSSYERRNTHGDSRDLYLVAHSSAVRQPA